MGKYEVTQEQWEKVMGGNPSQFKKGNRYPVEQVSWDDARHFVAKLNEKTGKQFRLPTEAEWEHACRAKRSSKYCGSDNLDEIAWYKKNSNNSTHPVGEKTENAFGLHDMSGNVWEWCNDWYKNNYYSTVDAKSKNTTGPGEGEIKVFRGGGYSSDSPNCRAANRASKFMENSGGRYGFRLASSFPPDKSE